MMNVPEMLDAEGKVAQLSNRSHPSMFKCKCEFEGSRVDNMKVCNEDAPALINPCHLAENGHAADETNLLLPFEKSIDACIPAATGVVAGILI